MVAYIYAAFQVCLYLSALKENTESETPAWKLRGLVAARREMHWTVGNFPYRKGSKARLHNVEFAPVLAGQQRSNSIPQPAQLLAILVEGGDEGIPSLDENGKYLWEALIACAASACTLAKHVESELVKCCSSAVSEEQLAGGGGACLGMRRLQTLKSGLKNCVSKVQKLMEEDLALMQQTAPRVEVYDITVRLLGLFLHFFWFCHHALCSPAICALDSKTTL